MIDIDSLEIKDRERIAKEIAKTSEAIHRKHQALKTGKMEEDVALERYFKPIVEPLKHIVENTAATEADTSPLMSTDVEGNETLTSKKIHLKGNTSRKAKKKRHTLSEYSPVTSTPVQSKRKRHNATSNESPVPPAPINTFPRVQLLSTIDDDVFETGPNEPCASSVRQQLQTPEGQETFRSHFGPLGQKYMSAILSGDKNTSIDYVCGIYFDDSRPMLGDKAFDMDKDDNIIIDGVKYKGTVGLYELIFERTPDDTVCTDADKQKYKSILLATNAHRRDHVAKKPPLSNKGYKYKHVIAPLLPSASASRAG